jgi:hypothetical protein
LVVLAAELRVAAVLGVREAVVGRTTLGMRIKLNKKNEDSKNKEQQG